MITKLSWRWPFWLYTIETGLCLIAVILLADETYYDRMLSYEKQPPRQSRFLRLIGIEQWRSRHLRNGFGEAMMRAFRTIARPVVLLADFYYMCTFAWVVAINATLSLFLASLYNFGPKQIGNLIKLFPAKKITCEILLMLMHHCRLLLLRSHCCNHTRRSNWPLSS